MRHILSSLRAGLLALRVTAERLSGRHPIQMTAARDSIRDVWGPRTGFAGEGRWPERLDEGTTHEPERWVKSVCLLCSTGCGLEVGVKEGHIVGVRGDRLDRINRGRLGPKGLGGESQRGSANAPLIRRGGRLEPASWDDVLLSVPQSAVTPACSVRRRLPDDFAEGPMSHKQPSCANRMVSDRWPGAGRIE